MEKKKQIHLNVQVDEIEYQAFMSLGAPTQAFRSLLHDKLGDKEKILLEIRKCEENIAREQARKKELEGLLPKLERSGEIDRLEQLRKKNLSRLLEKPYDQWTSLNRQSAIELGKFKDKKEMEVWINARQNGGN